MRRRLIALIMTLVFVMTPLFTKTYAYSDNVIININGKVSSIQSRYGSPEIYNGKLTISLKPLVEALGYSMTIKDDIITIPTTKGDITLSIGKSVLNTPTKKIIMETNVVSNDTKKIVYVAPKTVVEALGFKYKYIKPGSKDNNQHIIIEGKIGTYALPIPPYTPTSVSFGNGIMSFKQTPANTYPLLEIKPLVEYMAKNFADLNKDGTKQYAFRDANSPSGYDSFRYDSIAGEQISQEIEVWDLTSVGYWEVNVMEWDTKAAHDVLNAIFRSLAGDKDGQYIFDKFYEEMSYINISDLSNTWLDCNSSSTQFKIRNYAANEIISVWIRLNPSSFKEDIHKVYGKGIINGKPTGYEYPLSECKPFVDYMEANFGDRDYQGYKKYFIDHKNSQRIACNFQYSPSGGELFGEVNYINVMDKTNNEGYWDVAIRMFGVNERRIIRQLLMALSGDDDGLYIFDRFTEAWDSNGKKGVLDKWQTAPNGRQYMLKTVTAGSKLLLK